MSQTKLPFDNPREAAQDLVAEVITIVAPNATTRDIKVPVEVQAVLLLRFEQIIAHWRVTYDSPMPELPALGALLKRLTDPQRHPRNGGGPYCEWCGVPMAQQHRIGSDCPVALAQRVQQDMKDYHAQVS